MLHGYWPVMIGGRSCATPVAEWYPMLIFACTDQMVIKRQQPKNQCRQGGIKCPIWDPNRSQERSIHQLNQRHILPLFPQRQSFYCPWVSLAWDSTKSKMVSRAAKVLILNGLSLGRYPPRRQFIYPNPCKKQFSSTKKLLEKSLLIRMS